MRRYSFWRLAWLVVCLLVAPINMAFADSAVSGKVCDADGKAIVGVNLVLFHQRTQGQPLGERVQTVQSNADGGYAFTAPLKFSTPAGTDWSDHFVVVASDETHAPGWSVWTGTDQPASGDIILEPAAMQPVQVKNADDEPLAGATIVLIAAGESFDRRPAFRRPVEFSPALAVAAATTDASGAATLRLPRTRQSLLISCPGYADQVILLTGAPQKDTIDCRMVRAGTVKGTVTDPDGKPLPDAWVCIANSQDHKPIFVQTDAEGRYVCDRLAARAGKMTSIGRMSDYSIYLVDHRFCSTTVQTNVEEGQTASVDLNADHGTLVRVTVVETDSHRAIGGACIGGVLGGHMVDGFTNEQGIVEWRAPAGEGVLDLRSPPGGSCFSGNVPSQRFSVDGEQQELTFELPKLEPLVNIRGKITDAAGKPVPGIEVMIACRDGLRYPISRANFILGASSGLDGGFIVKGFPAGRHLSIYATTRNRRSAATAEWDVPETGGDLSSPIVLNQTVSCDVDLSAAIGADVRNQRFMVSPIVGDATFAYVRPATVDAEGHLKMGGVIPGVTYRVESENVGPMIQDRLKKDIELVPN